MWLFPVNRGYGSEGPPTDLGWEVWPDAIYDIVTRMTRDYGRPAIEITENGCAYGDGPDAAGVVNDARRIEFYRGYLGAVARAIKDGADVRGFHAWTLTDNFEWSEGYRARFGLVWVDFATQRRIVKQSGRWYGDVARANAVL
jgi:beta-glucosidase